jgi:hypothetical protein
MWRCLLRVTWTCDSTCFCPPAACRRALLEEALQLERQLYVALVAENCWTCGTTAFVFLLLPLQGTARRSFTVGAPAVCGAAC